MLGFCLNQPNLLDAFTCNVLQTKFLSGWLKVRKPHLDYRDASKSFHYSLLTQVLYPKTHTGFSFLYKT